MFVSGGFRLECYARAGSVDEYAQRRFGAVGEIGGGSGIQIPPFTQNALTQAWLKAGIESYRALSQQANARIFVADTAIRAWMRENPKPYQQPLAEDSEPIAEARLCRREGMALAVNNIATIAMLRGGLQYMPFLGPKSISDVSPTPYYPFVT